jgi:hypothetical protein
MLSGSCNVAGEQGLGLAVEIDNCSVEGDQTLDMGFGE